jgi:ATP-dependent phosphofructokinase / diphosphate-dependent phosphofructokinase
VRSPKTLIDTSRESAGTIAGLRSTPGGAFGSCRYKLESLDRNRREYERLLEVFEAHDIGYFFYNGGGDSQDTAHKVSQLSAEMRLPRHLHRHPEDRGQRSAAHRLLSRLRLGGQVRGSLHPRGRLDVASMCETSTKVFVLEVMGRHAGWIAAAAGLAQEHPGDPPHIILLPEVPFDRDAFLARCVLR